MENSDEKTSSGNMTLKKGGGGKTSSFNSFKMEKEFNLSEKIRNTMGLDLIEAEHVKKAVRRLKEKWKEKGVGYDYMTCVTFLIEDINKIFGDKLANG